MIGFFSKSQVKLLCCDFFKGAVSKLNHSLLAYFMNYLVKEVINYNLASLYYLLSKLSPFFRKDCVITLYSKYQIIIISFAIHSRDANHN